MANGYYDITNKTLGKGHYGVVKLGRHCLTGEPVAIKIIEKSRLNSDSLNQLGSEIRILFRLSEYEHPNILKLYQTIDSEDKLFLITEYCGPHACDLHDYLLSHRSGNNGLIKQEAQIFFIQICSAISYCHSMGIVHRDLKPENILVTDYKHMQTKDRSISTNNNNYPLLKLIDFGFANQWYPDEKMRTSCGTLAYSAPELLLGEPYDGTKVDVWGLGLMLYILLYGGNPFMQINDNETLTKILDCSFSTPLRVNVDQNAIELLRSLIKRNPASRLPIDALLQHKWFSDAPKPLELALNYNQNTSSVNNNSKMMTPVVSPTLPSISEIKPLKNFRKKLVGDDVDDQQLSIRQYKTESGEILSHAPKCDRTRSLSITRLHSIPVQQQLSLPQTRSSINLGRVNNYQNKVTLSPISPPSSLNPTKSTSIYRPTSPDVAGLVILSEEEKKLHETVIQDLFRLTKLINSKSSIEASLKNARFSHRLFNQNSIQSSQIKKQQSSMGSLVKSFNLKGQNKLFGDDLISSKDKTKDSVDKLKIINSKLTNDDYIYATYQLTRDKILRSNHERLTANRQLVVDDETDKLMMEPPTIPEEDVTEQVESKAIEIRVSVKENAKGSLSRMHQRKLLQPQHKMRDKFTSFFRTGSTSPNNSMNISCDGSTTGGTSSNLNSILSNDHNQHDAFNELNTETSAACSKAGSYFGVKQDPCETSMAYALPLARKCSLVSEEPGCSNELPEN